jgi:hypothetical protein
MTTTTTTTTTTKTTTTTTTTTTTAATMRPTPNGSRKTGRMGGRSARLSFELTSSVAAELMKQLIRFDCDKCAGVLGILAGPLLLIGRPIKLLVTSRRHFDGPRRPERRRYDSLTNGHKSFCRRGRPTTRRDLFASWPTGRRLVFVRRPLSSRFTNRSKASKRAEGDAQRQARATVDQ